MRGWKKYEKDLTAWLDYLFGWHAERKSRGKMGEEVEDIAWGPLSVEAKCKEGRPQYLEEWLQQAKDNSEGKVPIVVWHQAYEQLSDDVVILRLGDLVRLLKKTGPESNMEAIRKIMRGMELIEIGLEGI